MPKNKNSYQLEDHTSTLHFNLHNNTEKYVLALFLQVETGAQKVGEGKKHA